MNATLTFTSPVHFKRAKKGMLRLVAGAAPAPTALPPGRVPKLARLMALAIRLDGLLRAGDVADFAELARIGHVSRARVTQIMNLLMLAPDIQEAILFLPLVEQGRDRLKEGQVRPIAGEMNWGKQRRMWRKLVGESR